MGRLMDAVLAVSALVMVSGVAWTDWVISCCGIASEAMSYVIHMKFREFQATLAN